MMAMVFLDVLLAVMEDAERPVTMAGAERPVMMAGAERPVGMAGAERPGPRPCLIVELAGLSLERPYSFEVGFYAMMSMPLIQRLRFLLHS